MEEVNIENVILKDGFAGDRRYLKDRYLDDTTKVIYLISRLYGNAMNWAATYKRLGFNQVKKLINDG
ncbi:hypothetical protein BCR32DRAFT_286566 [Anaeromyces robustus]|uniref:Uncharacterized protein n=1 Tax=Anaeromyces robustus TaxID=1754192 RepID=A0A1Y1VWE3_9FUNG|nr:hypothetical protein BCR32DRAFT_286566 [Anaeromyces robustus]|eukprot:ORX65345.1 hypothetical protein BCR32DRAFT_286566 [Anaeromyces robustus]